MGKSSTPEQEETPYQKELSKIATEKWNKYQETYVDLENQYMSRVDEMDDPWQKNLATGDANKATQTSFSDTQDQIEQQQFQGGINPNSGKFQATTAQLENAKATSKAGGETQALQDQQNRYASGIQSVIDMGQGQSIDAQQGLTTAASISGDKAARDAKSQYQSASATRGIVGTGFGMAASYGLNNMGTTKTPVMGDGRVMGDV